MPNSSLTDQTLLIAMNNLLQFSFRIETDVMDFVHSKNNEILFTVKHVLEVLLMFASSVRYSEVLTIVTVNR